MTMNEWQALSKAVHGRADRIYAMKRERIIREAHEAGIGCGEMVGLLHNAALDTSFTGWCAGPDGPKKLRAAKRLNRELGDWSASRLAERISHRAWLKVQR